ncbi:hypothetical protein [Paenibacillus tyrfis]|uniref:hypothetical protein n=1 Tax=Paenibacillus tyrfis TaxID=1501230 RepID=UPI00209C9171|nr:hypothetical protein [Paenibacillus tyrfis]MCP1312254.1 hypothetical protein [Paenibacillus tyrfis]
MKIYGFYGRSGTGESHKVQALANKVGVNSIIDDGILIVDQSHVAGVSAKCERLLYSATQRAIFHWDDQKNEVKNYIRDSNITKLIIIGTSQKMITRILNRLELPPNVEWISVDSIQSTAEINLATNRRQKGFHAIPIKPTNVQRTYNGWYKAEKFLYSTKTYDHHSQSIQGGGC